MRRSSDVHAKAEIVPPKLRRRRHSRLDVLLPVTLKLSHDQQFGAQCVNLSLGGMFIQTAATLPIGTHITVFLTLPDTQRLVLPAVVAWRTQDGMGVHHELLGARDTFVLSEYLASLRE